ncbi:MAG: carbon-nitrogen hydrolase family protein [Armatimonadetes bacterium]|nr:carbon-nitrogen hydrolase family protein [Armatimonadota bacterium]
MSRPVALGMINVMLRSEPLQERRRLLLERVEDAGQGGCRIVLIPEFADHHCTHEAGEASGKGQKEYRRVAGMTIDAPWLNDIAALARRYRMVVIPDVLFLEGERATNTALVFGPEGALLGSYSKTHLAPGEKATCSPGNRIDTIETPYGKIGLLICWDVHFPELTRIHELQGADILLWSTMRQVESEDILWHSVLPARCWDHSLPIGVATYVTRRQVASRKPMAGTIFNAFGQVVAGGCHGEGVVRGVVDLDHRPHDRRYWGRPDWVNAGPYYRRYRRPDLYGPLTASFAPGADDPDQEPQAADYPDMVNPVI